MRHLQIEGATKKQDASNISNIAKVDYVDGKSKKNDKMKAPKGCNNHKTKMTRRTIMSATVVRNDACEDCDLIKKLKREASQSKANLIKKKKRIKNLLIWSPVLKTCTLAG